MINDGGRAFPADPAIHTLSDAECSTLSGMSLRDWFAGQAITGICDDSLVRSGARVGTTRNAAEDAYAIADAMIAERKKERK